LFSGVPGTPWYSNQYFNNSIAGDNSAAAVAAVNNFWTAMRGAISDNVSWTVQGDVAQIDEASGDLVGVQNVTSLTNTGASIDEELPFHTQALVTLNTNRFIHSRRLRGRVFIPGLGEANNFAGLPSSTLRAALDAAMEVMIADPNAPLVVYSRPFAGTEKNPARLGSFGNVESADVSPRWAVMRSRRD
jgi:hypothetical protein